jgi:hypothetical protein
LRRIAELALGIHRRNRVGERMGSWEREELAAALRDAELLPEKKNA